MTERSTIIESYQGYGSTLAEELGALTGTEVKCEEVHFDVVEAGSLAKGSDPIVHTPCVPKDDSGLTVHYLCSREHAVEWGGCLMGYPTEKIGEKTKEPLDEDMCDAFGEVMNLAAAVFERVSADFEKGVLLPGFSRGAVTEVANPEEGTPVDAGSYQLVGIDLILGERATRIDMYLPVPAAEEWLGDTVAPKSHKKRKKKKERKTDGPILLIDPDEEDRKAFEGLSEELGRRVWAVEPTEFGRGMLEEIADAGGVVVTWDLGFGNGMDVLELLLSSQDTCKVPVALASAEPTKPMVLRAMNKGAKTFLMKPYLASEISVRLLDAEEHEEEPSEEAAPAGDADGAPAEATPEAADAAEGETPASEETPPADA